MKLTELWDETKHHTDKNTTHSYLEVYDEILAQYKDQEINLLEIGNNCGGSIKLWLDYFSNITIHGLEINDLKELHDLNEKHDNVNIKMGIDAYSQNTVDLIEQSGPFDIIIDDGSHLPVHQLFVINNYLRLLKSKGLMVIEDIQDVNLISVILNHIDVSSKDKIVVFDRRNIKNRFDDIIIIIQKDN